MKKLAANLALSLVAVLVTLVGLEGLARLVRHFRGGGKEAAEIERYREFDPLLGWRKKPGARVVYHRREYTVEVAINQHGLRDRERDYSAPAGTSRILALGDSFIEGYSVALEDTVSQVLESRLRGRGYPVEVINGGTAGYSTDQEYLFYRTEGLRYSPNIVLLFFFFNDVSSNNLLYYYGQAKPIFQLTGNGLKLHPPRPLENPYPVAEDEAEPPGQGSALLEWMEERMRMFAPHMHRRLARWGLWEEIIAREPHDSFRVYERKPADEEWWRTAKILEALAREVHSHGGRLLVVYIPSRMEVDERSWELTRLSYGLGESDWDRRAVVTPLFQIGQALGFPVLDLTPSLREAHGRFFRRAYFTFDGHWTALGHRTAAVAIARFLQEHRWLDTPATLTPEDPPSAHAFR